MSTYNSIAISLDASDHWKKQSHKYDLSGDATRISTPREIHVDQMRVSPVPEYVESETSALLSIGKDEESDERLKQDPTAMSSKRMLIMSIILSSLFFGFSIGFSIGYLSAENGVFTKKAAQNDIDPNNWSLNIEESTEDGFADEGRRFIDEFLFHENSLDEDGEQSQDPMMRFPFQVSTPSKPIYLNGPDAYSLLLDTNPSIASISDYSRDFFLIMSGMDTQINQAYCGAATVAAIINSLRYITKPGEADDGIDIPVDKIYAQHPYATQKDIFNSCTEKTVIKHTGGGFGQDGILTPPYGLSMGQVANLLKCHLKSTKSRDWTVTTQYVDATHQTVGKLRFDLKNALQDPFSRVLVNYNRTAVGQSGGGHWSPIGSYSEKLDMFLLLDVAKYKFPPTWIPTERLFEGLATVDRCGEWNYPDGQDFLSQEERIAPTPDQYEALLPKLGCKQKLRGYIVVSSS